jgi:hypothetical protein
MGTRSTVKFYSDWDPEIAVLSVYQQFDGYIAGVGRSLAEFLEEKKILNGYGMDTRMEDGYANGIGCLAAQYVAENKTSIGGFYCTNPEDTQEYDYEVRFTNGQLIIKVKAYDEVIFEGTPKELLKYEEE